MFTRKLLLTTFALAIALGPIGAPARAEFPFEPPKEAKKAYPDLVIKKIKARVNFDGMTYIELKIQNVGLKDATGTIRLEALVTIGTTDYPLSWSHYVSLKCDEKVTLYVGEIEPAPTCMVVLGHVDAPTSAAPYGGVYEAMGEYNNYRKKTLLRGPFDDSWKEE